MGWTQSIEYVDLEVTLPPPVTKMVWDGERFVPIIIYKQQGVPRGEKLRWFNETYGYPGIYINGSFWDYSYAGDFTVMDEKIYTWFQIKWGNK